MKLYNTLSAETEEFFTKDRVRMYVCGPTPHARAHLGHAKSYISFDVLRRYLQYRGFGVEHVMCITDVAEEVVKKSGGKERDFALRFEELFFSDMARVGNLQPTVSPRISENVEAIIETIGDLMDGGHALERQGRIVLSMDKDTYGPLSHSHLGEIIFSGEEDSGTMDMLLWDPKAPGRQWESPWGKGRPGWHIQCYTMIKKYLGIPLDLHGGGLDLVFPHHESENMVSRLLDGVDSSRFWVHNGLMMSGTEKMSKTRGVSMDLKNMLNVYGGGALRMFVLSSHYRANNVLSNGELEKWSAAAKRLAAVLGKNCHVNNTGNLPDDVLHYMDDDLQTDLVIHILLEELDGAEAGLEKSLKNVVSISKLLGLADAEY